MFADDGGAEDLVLAWYGQDFDDPLRFFIGNRAVKIVDCVCRDFISDAALAGVLLIDADARNLGIGKCRPGYDRIVGAKFSNAAKQCIDRSVPGLMRSG